MIATIRRWCDNIERRQVTVGGVQPVPRGIWGAMDRAWSHGLAGRSGTIRHGDGADPVMGYRGYLAYQRLGGIPVGAAATLRRGPDHLPSTHGDVREVLGRQVHDLLDDVGGRVR